MRHHNSVFHELVRLVPWAAFDRLVDKHDADHRVRRLPTRDQFLALLLAQLADLGSLREIEEAMASQKARLYHVGTKPPARSTLSDANARRPAGVFADLFAYMAGAASRRTRRHMADAVRILDATQIRFSSLSGGWLKARRGLFAAKVHLVFDPHADTPMEAVLTDQSTADIAPARAMTIIPGMTYVFDMAYYDYAWWARLDAAGCRFVTRLKSSTELAVTAENPVAEGGPVLSDRIGLLPARLSHARRNPMSAPIREITVRSDAGKILRIVTNDLDAPAEEIAALYKTRWQVELAFKWIKQNLEVRHFLGTSENAVRIQIFIALIAYILLRTAHTAQKAVPALLTYTRLIRLNLMERRSIALIKTPPNLTGTDPRQLSFETMLA